MPHRPLLTVVPLLAILFCTKTLLAQPTKPAAENLVKNPGFEDGMTDWSHSGNGAIGDTVIDSTVSHSGKNSLRMTNSTKQAPNVFYRAYQTMQGVQPYTTYRFSCWVKGDESGDAFIGGGPGWGVRKAFPRDTFDWQQVSMEWSTGDTAEDFELMLVTQSPTKACWVDDIEFTPIKSDDAKLTALQGKLNAALEAQKSHLAAVGALAQQHNLADDVYVTLGATLAQRFIGRVETMGLRQNMSWSTLQLEEVDTVLKKTEARINDQAQKLPGTIAWPDGGPVEVRDGLFYTGKVGQSASNPYFFGGMGHFGAVYTDLPVFKNLGISLIQDGRQGPTSLTEDGKITPAVEQLDADLDSAAKNGVKVDFILSPHYFPTSLYKQHPDLINGNVGFISFIIDHPIAREVIERWLRLIVPRMKDKSALLSYCLTNEPAYVQSGKDPWSKPKFAAYLKQVHGDIAQLNALYGKDYKSFDDAAVPTRYDMPKELNERRAWFDWCRFNQVNLAEWHKWMNDIVKSLDPHAKTHAKVLVLHVLEQSMSHFGIDPELICEFTDIAGCDNFIGWGNNTLTSWLNNEFYYDLMNSFRNQPVFNSESHFIPDAFPPAHIPGENSRAVIWQGILHHMGATTIWVWDEPLPGLLGNIALRPDNIYGVGRALLDANRLSSEVALINQVRPRVALLYSQPSIYWEEGYGAKLNNLHTYLKFAGEKVTFVTERQLAAGKLPDVDVVLTSRATHVADATVAGLQKFIAKGGHVILCGEYDLELDPYHRERRLPAELQSAPRLNLDDAPKVQSSLVEALRTAGLSMNQIIDAKTNTPANGVEYRIVNDADGTTLIPLINFTDAPITVRLPDTIKADAIDLLSGKPVQRAAIELQPMIPLLLRCGPSKSTG